MLWREKEGSTASGGIPRWWVASQLRETIAACRALAKRNLSRRISEKSACCFDPVVTEALNQEKDALVLTVKQKRRVQSEEKDLRSKNSELRETFIHSPGQLKYCGWLHRELTGESQRILEFIGGVYLSKCVTKLTWLPFQSKMFFGQPKLINPC